MAYLLDGELRRSSRCTRSVYVLVSWSVSLSFFDNASQWSIYFIFSMVVFNDFMVVFGTCYLLSRRETAFKGRVGHHCHRFLVIWCSALQNKVEDGNCYALYHPLRSNDKVSDDIGFRIVYGWEKVLVCVRSRRWLQSVDSSSGHPENWLEAVLRYAEQPCLHWDYVFVDQA